MQLYATEEGYSIFVNNGRILLTTGPWYSHDRMKKFAIAFADVLATTLIE